MSNNDKSNSKSIVWISPGDAFSPWILSGITREICTRLSDNQLLTGAVNANRLEHGFQKRHKWTNKFFGNLRAKFNPKSSTFSDERDSRFRRLIDRLPADTALVYQFLTPQTDPTLDLRRYRLVDISLTDAIRTGSYGHNKLSDSQMHIAFTEQKRMYDACDGVLTLSTYAADAIARDFSYPRSKITPIGAGATVTPFSEPSLDMKRYSSARILFVGRNWERKGGPLLLEAFRIVRKHIPHATLTIVGPESPPSIEMGVIYRAPINKAKKCGQRELAILFSTASVFCMPSVCETWGLVYTEANAFGTPIVGFSEWALPDIVRNGETGLLASERTSGALAESLINALSDAERLQTFGVAARKRYYETLDWPHVINRLNFRLNHSAHSVHSVVDNLSWLQESESIHQIRGDST